MKSAILLGAALLALSACSTNKRLLAPDPEARHISKEKPSHPHKRGVDPVCGVTMDHADAFWHSDYLGTKYYFDSEECKRQFDENPDLFSATIR